MLLRNADAAMYQAMQQGHGTLRFFSTELSELMAGRLAAEQRLREAIRCNHLLLHFQPLVMPGGFISVAEETGLIQDIGRYVLHAACSQARAWFDAGHQRLTVSVNASPLELHHERYADSVLAALEHFALPPSCLEIEITECAWSPRA